MLLISGFAPPRGIFLPELSHGIDHINEEHPTLKANTKHVRNVATRWRSIEQAEPAQRSMTR